MTSRYASVLRTRLRAVNMEYSSLVRDRTAEIHFVRLGELKNERRALMALLHGGDPTPARRTFDLRLHRRHVAPLQATEQ